MNQFKKAQVVMLKSSKKSDLGLTFVYGETIFEQYSKSSSELQSRFTKFYNLYFISDTDEIKEGDNVYSLITGNINIVNNSTIAKGLQYKKIIATTDTSLTKVNNCLIDGNDFDIQYLPEPSQQFIEKYIEEYNKGNVIKDVLVEYEEEFPIGFSNGKRPMEHFIKKILKINTKDNTITIKKLKESWNREEVNVLAEALEKIIEMNYQTAEDKYGDKNIAEGWSCIRVAKEALNKFKE